MFGSSVTQELYNLTTYPENKYALLIQVNEIVWEINGLHHQILPFAKKINVRVFSPNEDDAADT